MERRNYLTLMVGAVGVSSGCVGSGSAPTLDYVEAINLHTEEHTIEMQLRRGGDTFEHFTFELPARDEDGYHSESREGPWENEEGLFSNEIKVRGKMDDGGWKTVSTSELREDPELGIVGMANDRGGFSLYS